MFRQKRHDEKRRSIFHGPTVCPHVGALAARRRLFSCREMSRRLYYYGLLEDLYPEVVPLFAIHPDMPYERILRQDDSAEEWRDVRTRKCAPFYPEREKCADAAQLRYQQELEEAEKRLWRKLRKRAKEVTPTPHATIVPWVGSLAEEEAARRQIILSPDSTTEELDWAAFS